MKSTKLIAKHVPFELKQKVSKTNKKYFTIHYQYYLNTQYMEDVIEYMDSIHSREKTKFAGAWWRIKDKATAEKVFSYLIMRWGY